MREKKSNKMKEKKCTSIVFLCVTNKSKPKHLHSNILYYCLFTEALSLNYKPLGIIFC